MCPTAQPERIRNPGSSLCSWQLLVRILNGGDGTGHEQAFAGVLTIHPPCASTAREPRASARDFAEMVSPTRQFRRYCKRCRFEIVAVVADRPTEEVPLRIDLTSGTVHRRDQQCHRTLNERQRFDRLTNAGNPGTTANKTERHVCSYSRSTADIRVPSPSQDRSRVRRTATEPGAGGDLFVESNLRGATAKVKGPPHQVLLFAVQSPTTRTDDLKGVTFAQFDCVIEVEAHHFRVDQVIPVIANSRDAQRHRQLRRRKNRVHTKQVMA